VERSWRYKIDSTATTRKDRMRLPAPHHLIHRTISLVLAGCLLVPVVATPDVAIAIQETPGRAIVVWREGASGIETAEAALERAGMRIERTMLGGRAGVIEDPELDTATLVKQLETLPGVLFAEPDQKVYATAIPNDPEFEHQWAYTRIQGPDAWGVERGDPDVVVAVIDTGADLDHEDLLGQLDTVNDRNFLLAPTDANYTVADDDNGHGTHVTGIVAAATDNSKGVAGTAPLVKVLPLKVLNSSGEGQSSDVIPAIEYAVSQGVDVIYMSLALQYGTQSEALHVAIQQATAAGVVVVAASGNNGSTGYVSYPAAYPECIAVGATGVDDARVSYSNAGTALDVMAPGGSAVAQTVDNSILSTYPGNRYAVKAGTSMATPFVSGTVALMRAVDPTLTVDEIRSAIEMSAKDIGAAGFDTLTGYGLLQMRNALYLVAGTDSTPPVTTSNVVAAYDDIANIVFTADDGAGLGVGATYYTVDGGTLRRGTSASVTGYGTRVVGFWSDDVVGNAEATKTVEFFIDDTIPPVTTTNAVSAYDSQATITLSANDGSGSGVTGTRYSLDGSAFTTGTVVSVADDGGHTLQYQSVDACGNTESLRTLTFTVLGVPAVSRVAGANRYETALALSRSTYGDGSASTVILASGEDFPDALSASSLAGVLDAPLLLTTRASLPAEVAAELIRLGASDAIIVGGVPAVSATVASQLTGMGLQVSRIAGTDRYDTAARVAARVATETGAPPVVFLARGDTFPDALAASSIAAAQGFPVLLTRTSSLPAETSAAIMTLGVSTVIVAGSTAAVDANVFAQVEALPGVSAIRRGGANRYDTAASIVNYGLDQGWIHTAFIGVATGVNFPDALVGGIVAAEKDGVMLLTSPTALSAQTRTIITDNGVDHMPVWVYGSKVAVSDQVKNAIAALRF